MAFKEFQRKRTHGGEAAVTITHFGNFALNSKTVAQYFQGNRYAKLYWDDDSKKVGIKPLKKKEEYAYSVNISPKGNGGTFSGTAFFKTYGIKYDKTRSFLVHWNDKEGLLEFKIS